MNNHLSPRIIRQTKNRITAYNIENTGPEVGQNVAKLNWLVICTKIKKNISKYK